MTHAVLLRNEMQNHRHSVMFKIEGHFMTFIDPPPPPPSSCGVGAPSLPPFPPTFPHS